MDQDWQRTALEGLFSALERKTQPMADHVGSIPVDTYGSALRLDAERALFRRHPIAIGAASQVQSRATSSRTMRSGRPSSWSATARAV